MTGLAYLAAFAALTVGGWLFVIAATQDRPLHYRGQHRIPAPTVHTVPAVLSVTTSGERPSQARTDLEPSAFDRLVGVHGYQRPAYESPGTPPPAPEPVAVHEGATDEWAQVLHDLPTTAADVNLQGLTVGSKDWWDAAGPCPDSQWWDEWVGQYTAELDLIGRCHQQAIDEAFGELALTMCRTGDEMNAFRDAYEAKREQLAAIDVRAAELVTS